MNSLAKILRQKRADRGALSVSKLSPAVATPSAAAAAGDWWLLSDLACCACCACRPLCPPSSPTPHPDTSRPAPPRSNPQLASPEVKFEIDTETHDPLDVGMYQVGGSGG